MICKYCSEEIGKIEGCLISHIKIGKETYEREKADPFETRCHDCGAGSGNYHHPGCDMERCPKCEGQMIWCDCIEKKKLIKRNK